jgi:tripartite-type tricarboxylate transporter receptor subunit TctC
MKRRTLAGLLALAAGLAATGFASAQVWPTRPVTLVVGTPAGGAIDAYARALAEQLAQQTGGTFLVDNKPGANGNLSAEATLKAPADGHTLWIGTQSMVTINPSAFDKLRWKPADFVPIVKGIEAPLVLVTHPSVPAHTLAELVAWAKANPSKAAYASFSPGTPSHFLGFQLSETLGLNMVHIPYKGSAPQTADLVGGQVPLGFGQLQTSMPHIQAGKLNAIAVTSAKRSRFLPNVPTFAELGHPELTTTIWFGVLAPAGTPKPVLDAIMAANIKAQAAPALRARLEAQNFDVSTEHGEAFSRSIAAESVRWAKLVKATGFKAAN